MKFIKIKKIVIFLTVFVGMQELSFADAGGFRAMLMARIEEKVKEKMADPAEKAKIKARIEEKMKAKMADPAEKAKMMAKVQDKMAAKAKVTAAVTTNTTQTNTN